MSRAPEPWTLCLDPFPRAPSLTGGRLDRADNLRAKPHAIADLAARAEARLLFLWQGKPLIDLGGGGPRLAWREMDDPLTETVSSGQVFLGLEEGAARFAVDLSTLSQETPPEVGPVGARKFIDLRSICTELSAHEAAIVAEAKSLTDWHRSHLFCALCGAQSDMAMGGWRRDCPACGAKHFPRTDPVVIMLIARRGPDGADRLVLGRQRNWPPSLYSLLAGYVEPGESIEEAVRRETFEEAGLEIGRVVYLASQPWPFPSTLMIGCYAEALGDALTPDLEELEDVRWVTRADMAAAFEGRNPQIAPPRQDAIAHTLVRAWVDGVFDRGVVEQA